jgi:ABC-type sugar transport system substrate-binding protein/predicted Ser/Thr protein kinase
MQLDHFLGKQIDAFTIQERIGQGGMATVYRAFQASMNRSVALKIISLNPSQGERDEFRSRFAQEAKLIASLEHIHILPVYDYGIVNNEIAFLAMRLLRGGSLSDLLNAGPLGLDRTAEIFTQIARGLAYAHSKGVIHRDLKPSNILLDDTGNAYLTDFGLAKILENSEQLTKTGNIVGTPTYMSPEQLRGDPLDHRSDIYSMGCVLYHMLVGRPPFEASETNMVSVIYQHLEKIPALPSSLNPIIPPGVEAVIMRALAKKAEDRFSTAGEMADHLNMALGRKISTATYPAVHLPTATQQTAKTDARKPVFTARMAALAGLVVIVALVAVLTMQLTGSGIFTPTAIPTATPVPDPTIIEGGQGTAEDAVPTADEIAAAQARLGANGFIAYITCNQSSEYHAAQAREMADAAARYQVAFRIYNSDSDRYKQVTELERARADGAKGLIICPLDMDLLRDTLLSVEAARMPLVFMSTQSESYGGVFLAGDDYLMGVEAGRAAGEIIRDELDGQANVIILDYPSLPYIVARANGMQDGMLEVAPAARIIGRYLGAIRDNGRESVADLLDQGVDFNVILSINDAGSYGAIDALEDHDIDPSQVIISSVDAEAFARGYIRDNYFMRASVDVGRELFSQTGIDAMVKLLAGATLSETFLVPPGGVITREDLVTE